MRLFRFDRAASYGISAYGSSSPFIRRILRAAPDVQVDVTHIEPNGQEFAVVQDDWHEPGTHEDMTVIVIEGPDLDPAGTMPEVTAQGGN